MTNPSLTHLATLLSSFSVPKKEQGRRSGHEQGMYRGFGEVLMLKKR
jgi:hypothetical protein